MAVHVVLRTPCRMGGDTADGMIVPDGDPFVAYITQDTLRANIYIKAAKALGTYDKLELYVSDDESDSPVRVYQWQLKD